MADQVQFNQRVVYYALRRMTESRNDISAGFARWRQQFETKPLDIIEVVTDLVAHLGLDIGAKKALMLGLHSGSAKLFDELEPVPTMLLGDGGAAPAHQGEPEQDRAPEIVSNKPAEIQTLERFLQVSSQYLKRSNAGAHTELMDIIIDEGLPSARKGSANDIKAWGSNGLIDISFNDRLSEDACQNIAHDYYVLLSEVVGPVSSDTIINKTIDELLLSELAQKFNPRDLL